MCTSKLGTIFKNFPFSSDCNKKAQNISNSAAILNKNNYSNNVQYYEENMLLNTLSRRRPSCTKIRTSYYILGSTY